MRKLVLFVWTVYDIPHCYDDDYGQPYHVSIPRQVLWSFRDLCCPLVLRQMPVSLDTWFACCIYA